MPSKDKLIVTVYCNSMEKVKLWLDQDWDEVINLIKPLYYFGIPFKLEVK